MKLIKRFFGIVWILLGLIFGAYIIITLAWPKCSSGKGEDLIAGVIYIFLTPIISLSLILFGYYALSNDYNKS